MALKKESKNTYLFKTMKNLLTVAILVGAMVAMVSCSDDDNGGGETPNTALTGKITADMTLTADKIWTITGRVIVTDGVTLTIEPGTIIKGTEGSGTNAAILMIARGGKINAKGTAAKPIIMTSVLDDIQVGQLKGTNLTDLSTSRGKWGGLVILGKAPVSVDGALEGQIEGVPAAEPLGLYGGNVAGDNSGVVEYMSIRYGGTVLDAAAGKDVNGLTLGGVGSGTTIKNVEIYGNVDDGIEFFGGSVNVSNALISFQGDDALDVDQAYSGTVNNFMLIQNGDGDEALEIDGPEGSDNADGLFKIQNGTVVSKDGNGSAADFKSKAQGTVTNVKFSGYTTAKLKFRASYTDCTTSKTDAFSHLVSDPAKLTLSNVEFNTVSVYTESEDANKNKCTVPAADQTAAEGKVVSATTSGASDAGVWNGWTLTSLRNEL